MEYSTNGAKVWYEEESKTIFCEGTFRLGSGEYAEIAKLLNEILASSPEELNLDLRGLEFLNSSGINVIAKFVIAVRNAASTSLSVFGATQIPWQSKSLPNLKKLYPALNLVID